MAFIGWFLLSAAQESVTGTVVRETLRNITVGQLMDPAPHAAAPHMTIAQLLTQFILPGNQHMAPVAQDGRAVGIITLSDIKDVPQEDWGTVTVGDRMTRGEQLRTVRPQDNLTRAMELLGEGDFDQLLVVDAAGQLVGVLTRAQVLRWLHVRDELKLRQQGVPAPPAPVPPRG
jgi:predicted transcriptional regulator